MTWDGATEPARSTDALKGRLVELARQAGLPPPDLEVKESSRDDAPTAHVVRWPRPGRIVINAELLGGDREGQTWHLASALAGWCSPAVRRRRRVATTVSTVLLSAWLASGAVNAFNLLGDPDRERVAGLVAWLLGPVVPFVVTGLLRWARRAQDAAGLGVLFAAGHDPVALTRQVFGRWPEPSLWRRLSTGEPSPRERLAMADRWSAAPAPSLH